MPIHPGIVEPLAERTRDLYAAAEERLLGIIARQLADGLDALGWAERKLAAVQQLHRASQGVVDELDKAVSLDVFDAVAEAYSEGHRAAVPEIGALSDQARALVDDVTPSAQAVDRLAQETVDRVTSTHRSILRAVLDIFRAVVAEVTATPLLGTGTRRQATQDAMRRFADAGIHAFVDKAGRRWQLTSYAEMAVRTSVARAATEAHMRTLSDAGIELVVVSDSPRECPLCRPWEGKVLAIDGPAASARSRSSTLSMTAAWSACGSPAPSTRAASPDSNTPIAGTRSAPTPQVLPASRTPRATPPGMKQGSSGTLSRASQKSSGQR